MGLQATGGAHANSDRIWLSIVGVAIVTFAVVAWFTTFVGYAASDDSAYLEAARAWLSHFPAVGSNWWSLRLPIVIPIAISIRLFGESEYVVALPTLLYQIGIASLSVLLARRIAGKAAALTAASLILTLPLFAIASSLANADLPEVFYTGLSLWLFLGAPERDGSTAFLLGAGMAAGLAIVTRETALPLILVYGVLFLLGFGIQRKRYWIMAVGFWIVVGGEMLYYWLAAGNPLYRYEIDLIGATGNDRPVAPSDALDTSGALRIAGLIDPVVMLFERIDFGLLYYLSIPAIVWVWAYRRRADISSRSARMMLIMFAASFGFAAVALKQYALLPRYYSTATFAMAIVIAAWFGQKFWPHSRRLGAMLLAVMIGFNFLGLVLVNKNPMFGTRALISYLSTSDVPVVYVNPATAFRGKDLFQWAGLTSRVRSAIPKVGDLYFFDPKMFDLVWPKEVAAQRESFRPRPNWQVVWRGEEPQRCAGRAIEWLGLDRFIPEVILVKLNRPNPTVTIYRVTGVD